MRAKEPQLRKFKKLGTPLIVRQQLESLKKGDIFIYNKNYCQTPWVVEKPMDESGNVVAVSMCSGHIRKINTKLLGKNYVYKTIQEK